MKSKEFRYSEDISLVLGGSAGQGLQTIEKVITMLFQKKGYHVFSTSEYMSRVRGGSNSVEIRVSNERKQAFTKRIDIAFPLDCDSFDRLQKRFDEKTIVIGNADCFQEKKQGNYTFIPIPLLKSAEDIGGKIFMNTITAGIILALFSVDDAGFREYLTRVFSHKGEDIIKKNIEAAEKGRVLGEMLRKEHAITLEVSQQDRKNELYLDGSHAVALGALAGGCNFMSSYPMSPSTGVLNAMAEYSQKLDIAVEQVEDEITAINMAMGAWYAGSRAIVSTSGGGFALMAETLSLSGMTENPVVIHLAQRPGPATGLPTRTEQGDLEFVLYGGHGSFPRVVFSPGNAEECFTCSKKAFEIADKFQVPTIIMTDQFLVDSRSEADACVFEMEEKPQKYFIETDDSYKRYTLTNDGLSPRGIPGFGTGFVHVDSDEHDEDGYIIEDSEMREKMMEKRMYRLELLKENALPPVYSGKENPAFLLVGWGSTHGVISEVVKRLGNKHVGYMHISQIFPLHQEVEDRIQRADIVIVIENNMTGQCADLLSKVCKKQMNHRIVQYDGWPFSVEELEKSVQELID